MFVLSLLAEISNDALIFMFIIILILSSNLQVRDFRTDWELQVNQPVAGNYYPVCSLFLTCWNFTLILFIFMIVFHIILQFALEYLPSILALSWFSPQVMLTKTILIYMFLVIQYMYSLSKIYLSLWWFTNFLNKQINWQKNETNIKLDYVFSCNSYPFLGRWSSRKFVNNLSTDPCCCFNSCLIFSFVTWQFCLLNYLFALVLYCTLSD